LLIEVLRGAKHLAKDAAVRIRDLLMNTCPLSVLSL
jgi:hypothetical protein